MTNTNPDLTATLVALRDGLLEQRSNLNSRRDKILAQLAELDADLDDNARKVEATDEVIAIHDPEHVRLDVRSSATPVPLVVVPRRQLQLAASANDQQQSAAPTEAGSNENGAEAASVQPAAEEQPASAAAPNAAPEAPARTTDAALAKTTAEAASAPEAPKTATASAKNVKPRKSAAAKSAISKYFGQFDRTSLIVKSLESRGQPTNATDLGVDIKALYPIDLDDRELRDMFASNVAAHLNYLLKTGVVTKEKKENASGRMVFVWSLADGYKKILKARKSKTRTVRKAKPAKAGKTPSTRLQKSAEPEQAPVMEAAGAQ